MIDDIIELILDMFLGSIFIAFMSVIFYGLGEYTVAILCAVVGIFLFIYSIIFGILIIEERRKNNKKWK